MHWMQDPKHPFAGIAAKLERADQNIANLHSEIISFFERSKFPEIPNPIDNKMLWQEAIDYHKSLPVPVRFSVLTGEIIHHLRSCFDHIVWIFSNDTEKRLHETRPMFPILSTDPKTDKQKLDSFEKQIKGVDKPDVRALIVQVQPYNRGIDPSDDPLCIIHDMDRFDKHRELAFVTSCANLTFPNSTPETTALVLAYREGTTLSTDDVSAVSKAVKQEAKVFPQVAFAKFGQQNGKFVIPSLTKLLNACRDVCELFAREL
jgi:hypothetical protein